MTKRIGLMVIIACMALLSVEACANTFYFQLDPTTRTGGRHQALIQGPPAATGTVTGGGGFSTSFTLDQDGRAAIDLPADFLQAGVVEEKGFSVTSSADLNVHVLNQVEYSSDMLHLIDSTRLGTDYVIAGYHNIFNDQISVQATADNTTVTISPKVGSPVGVMLNTGQTYLYSADAELTGSRVTADKPIAVQSGNACAYVPNYQYVSCDLLDEQIPSIDTLSTSYVVPRAASDSGGSLVRVVAAADDTEIALNGATIAVINKGDYYQTAVGLDGAERAVFITASRPVLVAEYLVGYGVGPDRLQEPRDRYTDPAMTVLPGTDQWQSRYAFNIQPASLDDVTLDYSTWYITVVIKTSALASLQAGGGAVDTGGFRAIGSTGFSIGFIPTNSPMPVTADQPFELLVEGIGLESSYFTYVGSTYTHGMPLPPLQTPPPQTPPPPNRPPNASGAAAANTLYFLRPEGQAAQLLLFGPASASGTLTNASGVTPPFQDALPFQLNGDGYAVIDLPALDRLEAGSVENQGWWITSDAALTGYFRRPRWMDTLIPGDRLGTRYVVPGGAAVQATQDGTTVTIIPKGGKGFNRVTLQAGQTYIYKDRASWGPPIDLSGASITADRPIVVSGQVPPVEALSTRYVLAETPRAGTDGNVVSVMATADGTGVQINGTTVATLDKGEVYEGRVKGGEIIDADHAVLVLEFLFPALPGHNGAWSFVPGVDRWQDSYVFTTPPPLSDRENNPADYASIVIPTASLPSLQVAGNPVDAGTFVPIGSTGYSYGNLDITSASGALTAVADAPFGLLLSRFYTFEPGHYPVNEFTYAGAKLPAGVASPPPADNLPPQCNDDSAKVSPGSSVKIPVLANDSDPERATLTVTSVATPTAHGGTVTINGDGSVTYVPPAGYTDSDSFTYRVRNSHGGTGTAQVELTITSGQGLTSGGEDPSGSPSGGGGGGSPGSAASPAAVSSRGGGGILNLDELLWLLVITYWRCRLKQALDALDPRLLP